MLVSNISKDYLLMECPNTQEWAEEFEETIVYVERVIAYWSCTLKSADRNYSTTKQEALGVKEALVKFQPFGREDHLGNGSRSVTMGASLQERKPLLGRLGGSFLCISRSSDRPSTRKRSFQCGSSIQVITNTRTSLTI